jgi:5'/3'-nucleotidase
MRILVTNDDGITAPGLRALAVAVQDLGDLMIVAPLTEHSGAGTSVGPFHLVAPRVHDAEMPGVKAAYVAAVEGPPSLAVLLARLGTFGPPPDLVVSGINPGINVGRAVYHSGTVGATIAARNGNLHGVAVSQDVVKGGNLAAHSFEAAAMVARCAVQAMMTAPPPTASVLNLNVPNLPPEDIQGLRMTEVGTLPSRHIVEARLEEIEPGISEVITRFADNDKELPEHSDGGSVAQGWVAASWLSRMTHHDPGENGVEEALDALLSARR